MTELNHASVDPRASAFQVRLRIQLCVFMFLQYFIWGAWYVTMGSYVLGALKSGGVELGMAYGAFAIGAMIAPFFVGLVADRYFASEKILGVLGLLGAGLMFAIAYAKNFGTFYPLLVLYCCTYTSTLALGNSLSLHQLTDAKVWFPRVKTLSAIGWIAGGLAVSAIGGEDNNRQWLLAGGISLAFGAFAFTLPHTPPRKTGRASVGEILGLDALALMKKPSFAIFIACMFLICIPLYFYFGNLHVYLGELKWTNAAAKMTLAQVSDVIFLFLLPVFLRTVGYKWTIFIGILCWVLRFFFLAQSVNSAQALQTTLIFAAIILHGVCYDFLFIAGQLYVDAESNERIRGAAQGFIAFILWGVGNFVGSMLSGIVQEKNVIAGSDPKLHNWQPIWLTPAILATVVMVIFLIFFRQQRRTDEMVLPKDHTALDEAPV